MTRRLLVAMARYPEPGRTKTRLARSVGAEAAAGLYAAFLADLVPRYHGRDEVDHDTRWAYVDAAAGRFERLIAELHGGALPAGVTFATPAPALGLGARQVEQLAWGFARGYREVVIVSTDSPQLPRARIVEAFRRLAACDVVLGPARDGGYYLLGTRAPAPILDGVTMSTDHVAADIRARVNQLGLSLATLAGLSDVDEWPDLERLMRLLRRVDADYCPATRAALRDHGLFAGRLQARRVA